MAALLTNKTLHHPVCFNIYKSVCILCFCSLIFLELYLCYILTVALQIQVDYLLILIFLISKLTGFTTDYTTRERFMYIDSLRYLNKIKTKVPASTINFQK